MTRAHSRASYRDAILAALPGTQLQIRKATGAGARAVCDWLADICAKEEAHIGAYEKPADGRSVTAVYHRGPGVPATRPERNEQRRARYAEKAKPPKAPKPVKAPVLTKIEINHHPIHQALFGR